MCDIEKMIDDGIINPFKFRIFFVDWHPFFTMDKEMIIDPNIEDHSTPYLQNVLQLYRVGARLCDLGWKMAELELAESDCSQLFLDWHIVREWKISLTRVLKKVEALTRHKMCAIKIYSCTCLPSCKMTSIELYALERF